MDKKRNREKIEEFLDNTILFRMKEDISILEKRLGFAQRKKEDLRQNHPKKWWEIKDVTTDTRHGIDPLNSRLALKEKQYEDLLKKMKKNKETVVEGTEEGLAALSSKFLRGNDKRLKAFLILTYLRYVQEVYEDGLSIESKSENFEGFSTMIFGDSKIGDNYFSVLKIAFGKISSLPKINRRPMMVALKVLLTVLSKNTDAEGLKDYIDAFHLDGIKDDFPLDHFEESAMTLALMATLLKSLEDDPHGNVVTDALIGYYLTIREANGKDCLLRQKDLEGNKKLMKMSHRFEDFWLEGKG